MWNYDAWISEQADKVRSAVNRLAMGGRYDMAVYVMPSNGSTQGELIVALPDMPPAGTVDVVRFHGVGSRVAAVPSSALHSQLWHACRRMPICPV